MVATTTQETEEVMRPSTESSEDKFSRYVVPELEVLMRVARSITGNPTDDPDITLALTADSETRTPESTVIDVTFDAAIERALATLPADYREILHLVDVNGLSYECQRSVVRGGIRHRRGSKGDRSEPPLSSQKTDAQ